MYAVRFTTADYGEIEWIMMAPDEEHARSRALAHMASAFHPPYEILTVIQRPETYRKPRVRKKGGNSNGFPQTHL